MNRPHTARPVERGGPASAESARMARIRHVRDAMRDHSQYAAYGGLRRHEALQQAHAADASTLLFSAEMQAFLDMQKELEKAARQAEEALAAERNAPMAMEDLERLFRVVESAQGLRGWAADLREALHQHLAQHRAADAQEQPAPQAEETDLHGRRVE